MASKTKPLELSKQKQTKKKRILLVEDAPFFLNVLHRRLENELDIEVVDAATFKEAIDILDAPDGRDFFLCLLDLVLPDALNGEIIDAVVERNMPAVVFTGMFSDEMREEVLSKSIIDYVMKDNPASLDYLTSLVRRIHRNSSISALVVDDSKMARRYISDLLELHQFNVYQARNGREALEVLEAERDIKLVVTDYYMPELDGFELVKRIRKDHGRDDLAIIGLSSGGSAPLSAKFIKYGANDFINKPFLREEFFCRISQNMDTLDYIEELAQAARIEPLTGLHNRRYLFDAAKAALALAKRNNMNCVVGLIDIDLFKKINDTYGHDAGDQVLVQLSEILKSQVRRLSDIAARIGGEEFCIFLPDFNQESAISFFEDLRHEIADTEFDIGLPEPIKVTVSIGICAKPFYDLHEMLKGADVNLYKAKSSGRNQICADDTK